MRKIISLFLLCLFITHELVEIEGKELLDIADFVTDNGSVVDEWTVTIKEKIHSNSSLREFQMSLAGKTKPIISNTTHSQIYFYENTHNYDTINVSFKVVIPKTEQPAELVAIIAGEHWNRSLSNQYLHLLQTITNAYFTKNIHVYTCLSTTESVIIDSDEFFQKVIEKFDIKNISTQSDNINNQIHKKIFYGYTQIWEKKLKINDELMNLQVVMDEKKNGKQKIIIGTPILINEY